MRPGRVNRLVLRGDSAQTPAIDTGRLPPNDPIWERLEDQIAWYDVRSSRNQRVFKRLKYVEILAAAAIPIVTGLETPRVVPAVLGGLVLVIEAIIHLNQYQQDWLVYRSTAEALKNEKFLFLAHAGPYATRPDARTLLAERVERLVSREHARWASTRQEPQDQGDHGNSSQAPEPQQAGD